MARRVLQPMISDESVIVQFADKVIFDKSLSVTVPNGYLAFVFADEKAQFRIEPCSEKKISSCGKELLGKRGLLAFVRTKPLPPMAWGFGNIQVNNDRLKEAYRIGANGKYTVEISYPAKLISYFNTDENITIGKLRDLTISTVKNIGISLLGAYFTGTNISVFEVSSCMNDFRAKFYKMLRDEGAFADMGLILKDLTVDGVHVPEEDIESIRSRINESEKKVADNAELLRAQERSVAELSRQMNEKFEQLRAEAEAKREHVPDIEGEIRSMREELSAELFDRLGDKMQEMRDAFAESMDERLQELLPLKEQAKEEYLKTLKMTAAFLLERAEDEDALVPVAAMLYTNIEESLIRKCFLRYENKKFVMDYKDFCSLAKETSGLVSRYDIASPTVLQRDEYGNPELVEMLPQVRFYKAGLSVADSLKARDYWCFLNKLRHRSQENEAYLRRKFSNFSQEKNYLAVALEFFKSQGLYTKE